MKLFPDANVLFTAAYNPKGKARFVIDQAGDGTWRIVSSQYALEEARRNLARKAPGALAALNRLAEKLEWAMHDPHLDGPRSLPGKDVPIFGAARAAGATHLLTGDLRDFGPLMNRPAETAGILIQTVADFLDSIE